jgi:coenzyme F420-dependent glucose-6-phosphate dehydrogenase
MATIAYHASHEQFSPSHLLDLAVKAERAGFDAIHSSDHFHPWSKRQGHSGFAFSWIAAAMQATCVPFSMVCAPGQRYHPAIVAQAIATLGEMFPSRFGIELGSGEALNENITADPWPEKQQRNERLKECADIIRELLKGKEVSYSGHVRIKEAKLYTLPMTVPPLFGCALTTETARWLGDWADGLLTIAENVEEVQERVAAFRNNGGEGKPVYLQFSFSYARQADTALMSAWDQWRSNLMSTEQLADLSKPEHFDEASKAVKPEEVAAAIPILTSVQELRERIRSLEQCCNPERVILHNVNHFQEDFIEDFAAVLRH